MAKAVDMVFADPELVKQYVMYRDAPPLSLINAVVERVKEGRKKAGGVAEVCVDMGCGSGQNTGLLAPHFSLVVGVDVSQPQLDAGAKALKSHPNVSFRVGTAEKMPFETSSVDLITCATAVHWFDFEQFYKEVDRVLRPGGVLACYSYRLVMPICNGRNLQNVMIEVYHELDRYWAECLSHLWDEYVNLPKLYDDDTHIGSETGRFRGLYEGMMEEILGYITSWSAVDKLRKDKGEEAAAKFLERTKKRLCEAAGVDAEDSTVAVTRQYDYYLRMWQKPHH